MVGGGVMEVSDGKGYTGGWDRNTGDDGGEYI